MKRFRFRRGRAEKVDTKASTWKDWSSTIISVAALVVSLTGAYFQYFRQVEDLKLIITSTPFISNVKNERLKLNGVFALSFLNLGTRVVAVTGLLFNVQQEKFEPEQSGRAKCSQYGEGTSFASDLEAFAVKPGEMVLKKIKLKDDPARGLVRTGEDGVLFPLDKKLVVKDDLSVNMCLGLFLASPSDADIYKQIDMGNFAISSKQEMYMSSNGGAEDTTKPISLLK